MDAQLPEPPGIPILPTLYCLDVLMHHWSLHWALNRASTCSVQDAGHSPKLQCVPVSPKSGPAHHMHPTLSSRLSFGPTSLVKPLRSGPPQSSTLPQSFQVTLGLCHFHTCMSGSTRSVSSLCAHASCSLLEMWGVMCDTIWSFRQLQTSGHILKAKGLGLLRNYLANSSEQATEILGSA